MALSPRPVTTVVGELRLRPTPIAKQDCLPLLAAAEVDLIRVPSMDHRLAKTTAQYSQPLSMAISAVLRCERLEIGPNTEKHVVPVMTLACIFHAMEKGELPQSDITRTYYRRRKPVMGQKAIRLRVRLAIGGIPEAMEVQ